MSDVKPATDEYVETFRAVCQQGIDQGFVSVDGDENDHGEFKFAEMLSLVSRIRADAATIADATALLVSLGLTLEHARQLAKGAE